jgi:hypothetical protein
MPSSCCKTGTSSRDKLDYLQLKTDNSYSRATSTITHDAMLMLDVAKMAGQNLANADNLSIWGTIAYQSRGHARNSNGISGTRD